MSFVRANDHANPVSPQDPLYYAPRSARSIADPRSNSMQQTRQDSLPPASSLSRFDGMREEAFAKYTRPLESQLVHERRPSRALLATASGITAAIVTAVVALLFLNGFPKPKSDPSELTVSISTPASATPAQVTSEDSQALLQRFKQFRTTQESENQKPAVSELTAAGTAKERPDTSQALLEKFIQWQQRN
ncbi:hypothetical protein [Bradyrhizobium sp. sBnM-33]|uniref:hypothetical protein n=1 Tax=Bradyrhizobium sp. sBnM-33 TaxID=2831780 RepID=UPI001BCCDA09|nr:hypothetical protein [Bradyrhizobium sp. sBnM-33]WOH46926.1 hypothetical protein RX328_22145 [Bradyrhizobium sp. sBnM-33]